MKKGSYQDKKQKHNKKDNKQDEAKEQPDKKDRKIIISKKDEVPSPIVEQNKEPEKFKIELESNWKYYEETNEQDELVGIDYKTLLEESCNFSLQ
jgi:hypothetical protein